MKLRSRLLLVFGIFAGLVIALFALLVYRVAVDASQIGPGVDRFDAITMRLIVTGSVVLWVSVWAALILSSWMAQRLHDEHLTALYHVQHDHLTGLANRNLFYEKLDEALKNPAYRSRAILVCVLDIDRFREFNDTLGHQSGDKLLNHMAEQMKNIITQGGVIARLGGDEFAILHIHDKPEHLREFVQNLSDSLAMPYDLHGFYIQLRSTMGMARYPIHGESSEALLRHAEVAMYKAKQSNTRLAFYDPESDPFSPRRLAIFGQLQEALEHDALTLEYQPKLDLHTGRIFGAEALVRWQHPELGHISPAEFVPIAEATGLIERLTARVLRLACLQAAHWRSLGLPIRVWVNFSTQNLPEIGLADKVMALLDEIHLPANALGIEITESVMMENINYTLPMLQKLRESGVSISIDDFGTGFSSLNYLKQLPVTELKIDQSFVKEMERNASDRIIVQSIIQLGHNLGHRVTAEGAENKNTLQLLQDMGCDTAQGYYIGKPMSAAILERWLSTAQWALADA